MSTSRITGYLGYSGVPAAHCAVPGPCGEQPALWQPLHTAHASPMLPNACLLPRKEIIPASCIPLFVPDVLVPEDFPCSHSLGREVSFNSSRRHEGHP